MERDEGENKDVVGTSTDNIDSQCAVNTLILDYYKKFGRKRDLEQFFSLSTAQSDINDTSGLFWRKMKSENDSSDSGGRRSDSSAHELCRISIRCSMPEASTSQSDDPKTKTESPDTESPPIIIEEVPADTTRQTDDESLKSDDNNSQKSFDPLLDLSAHKPLSPTSSITSQRKLEWDSLADVGYGNESDRKTSASSLSTLERLALQQQYSNNDSKQDIGPPTCHSTPVDENESKSKSKKGAGRKMTRIIKKDVDFVEVNVPRTSDTNPPQSINVNLTKHISFNVEKDGGIRVENIKKDVNVSPEKASEEANVSPYLPVDKESQTSLPKTKDKSNISIEEPRPSNIDAQKIPVMISLNTIRKRLRRKKTKVIRRRFRTRIKMSESKDVPPQEKSGEQLSEAESFEYMPGHIYNQNQMKANESRADHNSTAGNKSSLESSGGITTDSSKGSKHSLTKDLEKCIEVLKLTLQKRFDDGEMKKRLIKEIVQRLLNSKYRDDETTTDFLSGLSFNSKKLDLKGNNTTTSTSDANNTDDSKHKRPKKSILRMEKFDSNVVASTSQSVPNLFTATSTEKTNINLVKMMPSNTESDESSREKTSSDNALPKTSSEELYLKYLEALRREESYKRHLKDKEKFLKQKLGSSETAIKAPMREEVKINNRLKDLMKDLTRNNYDDGSGDASKLEGGSTSDRNFENYNEPVRCQRSHSVFTLSSSHSESPKKANLKKKMQIDQNFDASTSKHHYCCCPHHSGGSKVGYVDSSVQVNIKYQYDDGSIEKSKHDRSSKCQKCVKSPTNAPQIDPDITPPDMLRSGTLNHCENCTDGEKSKQSRQSSCSSCPKCGKLPKNIVDTENEASVTCPKCTKSSRHVAKMVPDKNTGEIKYVCVCKGKPTSSTTTGDFMIYKCSKLTNRGIQFEDPKDTNACAQCEGSCKFSVDESIQMLRGPDNINTGTNSTSSDNTSNIRKHTQSSQTNMLIKMMCTGDCDNNSVQEPFNLCGTSTKVLVGSSNGKKTVTIHEATRCLQTEISFNPKISDPSLSDIVIINNCAELISEQQREVNLNDDDTLDQRKTFSDVYTTSHESGKFPLRSGDSLFGGEIKDSDINIIESKNSNITRPEKTPNDYAIPIQGTNMTLMVTLASTGNEGTKEQAHQRVGAKKVPILDHGTSITAECAKSIQCPHNTATNSTRNTSTSAEQSSNKSSRNSRHSPRKNWQLKSALSRSPQRNTYPKVVVLKDKKPFNRSNTDTGKLETRSGYAQTESPTNMYPLTRDPETKTDSLKSYGQMSDTDGDKIMLRSGRRHFEEERTSSRKEIGIQKDLSGDEYSMKRSTREMVSKRVGSPISPRKGSSVGSPIATRKGGGFGTSTAYRKGSRVDSPSQGSDLDSPTATRKASGTVSPIAPRKGSRVDSPTAPRKGSSADSSTAVRKGSRMNSPTAPRKGSRVDSPTAPRKGSGVDSAITSRKGSGSQTDTEEKDESSSSKHSVQKQRDNDTDDMPKKKEIQKTIAKKGCCDSCGSGNECHCGSDADCHQHKDPIINIIQDITRRYSKNDIKKMKKKKCFTEIVTVLNYLLETEDSTDQGSNSVNNVSGSSDNNQQKSSKPNSPTQRDKSPKVVYRQSSTSPIHFDNNNKKSMRSSSCCEKSKKSLKVSESDSLSCKHDKKTSSKSASKGTESSDAPGSTDVPSTSDSTACKILNKIKKECEKYHLRRSKNGRKCEISSSTSVNCDDCKKVHHCGCRHKCKRSKTVDKLQKKCVAYNLILQTSESMLSEETVCHEGRPLQNIVVKVPKRKEKVRTETCKETIYKIEKGLSSSPRGPRSRSCPKETELSSADDYIRKSQQCTVREYLEKNRPDFVEKSIERQSCLKFVNEMRTGSYWFGREMKEKRGGHRLCADRWSRGEDTKSVTIANQRAAHRDLLSLHVDQQPDLTNLSSEQLRQLAQQIGLDIRKKKPAPKFISEREMKKHSEKIYKTLPEVVQKKEEKKKENIKKTNLLMANIFKKNLQKKTLRGSVNISNYSTVIKI